MNKYLLALSLISCQPIYGQLVHPYKVYSENQQYFIKSVPFSDQVWTTLGKTSVYAADDTTSAVTVIDRLLP